MIAKFLDIFEDVTKHGTKIPTNQYQSEGKYPIIDQGQEKIAGYTNQENGLFTDVPAILFGDHTRIVKYIDKPCFLGADGVKLLKAKSENANYKYLYYVLLNAKIPNTGYNRHFKWLKEVDITLYKKEEQKNIVSLLDTVTELIDKRKQQLSKLDELVKARFVEMFGGYERTTTIARYISELRGGKSLAGTETCKNKVLKTGAATFGWFDPEQYKYLPTDYEPLPEHKVETGDVIISRMNTPELVGACSYVFNAPDNMYYPDRLWKAILQENTNPIFLWQLLWDNDVRKAIKEKSGGTSGTMHNISKPNLLAIKCMDAPIELQNQFAAFVEQTDKSKLEVQKSLEKLEVLKKALMQKYFG